MRDLAGVQRVRMRLVLVPGKATNGIGFERDAWPAVQIVGCWVALEGAGLDVLALVASAREPGGYYLGNCGCGEPGCAGAWAPVQVHHEGNRITWRVPMPYARTKDNRSAPDAGPLALAFDAAEYCAQAEALLVALRASANDGGPPVRVNCYPGELVAQTLDEAENGGAGWGGREPRPD